MRIGIMLALITAALLSVGVAQASLSIDSTVKLGSSSQTRGVNASATFNIVSTENVAATLTLTSNSGYNIVFDDSTKTKNLALVANVSQTVTVKAFVPLSHSAINDSLKPMAMTIGSISASDNTTATASSTVTMQAKNMLTLDTVEITVNGDSANYDDGDEISDLRIGDSISVTATAINEFNADDENGDMENVKFVSESSTNKIDLTERESTDISADDEDTVALGSTKIEDSTKDSTYYLTVSVDGTDKNGARHGGNARVKLKVERDDYDIVIKSADLSPAAVTCAATETQLRVRVQNQGKKNSPLTAIGVASTALGINQKITDIDLDKDKYAVRTFTLNPKVNRSGTYKIDVVSYYANSGESHREQVTLNVQDCQEQPAASQPVVTPPAVVVVQPAVNTSIPASAPSAPKLTVTTQDSKQDYTIPVLVGAIVVAVVFLGVLLALLVRKPAA
jgi:hypothetical protein